MKYFIILLYVISFLWTPFLFHNSVPSVFEVSGFTFVHLENINVKYYFIPFMGLILSFIVAYIRSKKLFENSILFNYLILLSIFSIITIKLGISPLKNIYYFYYYKNNIMINIFNTIEKSLFKASIIILIIGIICFIKFVLPVSNINSEIKKLYKKYY